MFVIRIQTYINFDVPCANTTGHNTSSATAITNKTLKKKTKTGINYGLVDVLSTAHTEDFIECVCVCATCEEGDKNYYCTQLRVDEPLSKLSFFFYRTEGGIRAGLYDEVVFVTNKKRDFIDFIVEGLTLRQSSRA